MACSGDKGARREGNILLKEKGNTAKRGGKNLSIAFLRGDSHYMKRPRKGKSAFYLKGKMHAQVWQNGEEGGVDVFSEEDQPRRLA